MFLSRHIKLVVPEQYKLCLNGYVYMLEGPRMNRHLLREITEDEIATYEKDGVVCLRGMFDADWIDWLRAAADILPGAYGNQTFLWPTYAAFRELAFDSPVGEIAAEMMRSATCGITIDLCFNKLAHTKSTTPWHHDQPYYQVAGSQVCGMWIGLDKADETNGAMEWVKGSHKWSRMFEPDPFDGTGHYEIVHSGRERIPDIDAGRDKYDIVMFETEPGDCIVDHGMVLHSAGDNTTDFPRRAITYALFGDDAEFSEIPPSRGIEDTRELGLSNGDKFPPGHPLVPRIWPKIPRDDWPRPTIWSYTSGSAEFIAGTATQVGEIPSTF